MYNIGDVVSLRQFMLNTLSSLKARLRAFWWVNSKIKRAAIGQAVVIFFNVLRLEWPGEGPLFKLDSNKCRGQMWPLFKLSHGQLLNQAWALGQ